MIKTFGSGWEQEIPNVLKSDMGSLTQEESSSGSGGARKQPKNLQQRVISSGLDSISGADSESIVLLFKGSKLIAHIQCGVVLTLIGSNNRSGGLPRG
jgi:hypothetical protein